MRLGEGKAMRVNVVGCGVNDMNVKMASFVYCKKNGILSR